MIHRITIELVLDATQHNDLLAVGQHTLTEINAWRALQGLPPRTEPVDVEASIYVAIDRYLDDVARIRAAATEATGASVTAHHERHL